MWKCIFLYITIIILYHFINLTGFKGLYRQLSSQTRTFSCERECVCVCAFASVQYEQLTHTSSEACTKIMHAHTSKVHSSACMHNTVHVSCMQVYKITCTCTCTCTRLQDYTTSKDVVRNMHTLIQTMQVNEEEESLLPLLAWLIL